MNEQDIRKIAEDVFNEELRASQYTVTPVPTHVHTGVDSPQIPFLNLANVPASYTGKAGNSLIVNPTETGLIFGSGGGGGSPVGPNRAVQYNDSGSFGGDSNFEWGTDSILHLSDAGPANTLNIGSANIDDLVSIDSSGAPMAVDADGEGIYLGFYNKDDVVIGDGSAISTSSTTGFLVIPKCSGTPTGVPDLGSGAVVFDDTNNVYYVYNGSAWEPLSGLGSTVVTLTDGATPALNAALGSIFYLAAAGNRTIEVPSNPSVGQKIIIRHYASGGARTLSLNTSSGGFRFGSDIPFLSATASGKTDYIGCVWNEIDSFWDVVAVSKGY